LGLCGRKYKTVLVMTKHIPYTAADLAHLKAKVFEKTPILEEIVERAGKKTLFEYAKTYQENPVGVGSLGRREDLIAVVSDRAEQLFGKSVAISIASQLGKHFVVSTADHHGPVCHPSFLNANLLAATQTSALENILVFSTANVSLNNSSVPRGLIFHNDGRHDTQIEQLSFFPASERQRPVFGMHAYAKTDLARLKKNVWSKVQDGSVRMSVAERIVHIIDHIYGAPATLAVSSFSEQISLTNIKLWEALFSSNNQASPRLIYLDQERIVADLLISHHLTADSIISEIILDATLVPNIIKHFDGIKGGFSLAEKKGSYLFWALPSGSKYRQQLWLSGGELRTLDGNWRVPLEADALIEKLQSGELVPTMLLTFLVLCFYYGLKCLGGFFQPSYLTAMKGAYARMLKELGLVSELGMFSGTDTKTMGGDLALAFLQGKNKKLYHASTLDLILYGDAQTLPTLQELSKAVSVEESITIMLPLFYEVLYGDTDRDNRLVTIQTDEIIKIAALDTKIRPCASI
jgi:hypothetical protein